MKKGIDKYRLAFLTGALCFWAAGQAQAGDPAADPWEITADRITRISKPDTVVAEGNVVLQRSAESGARPMVIKADWLEYNRDAGTVHARGSLSMRSPDQEISGEEAVINLDDETATLTDTTLFVPENNLHFSGGEVRKEGPLSYRFRDGEFTTCRVGEGGEPPWRFTAGEARVEIEKVAVLRHTVLRVKGVPVFYLPWFAFPGTTKRKTGFLLPELAQSSRGGTGLITPYFINLSPSSDVTLYPGYMTEKGVVAGAEFRYRADARSRGTLAATYIHDRTEDEPDDEYKSDGYLRSNQDRYWIRGMVDHEFGDNLTARLDLDMASDRDYLQEFKSIANGFDDSEENFFRDFHRGLMEETLPFRQSRLQVNKTWSSAFLGGQVVAVDDLDEGSGPEEIHTLPRLMFDGVSEIPATPLSVTWNSGYVHYWTEEGVGEQRLDLHPRVLAPLPLGSFFDGTVSAGFRETLYEIDSHGDPAFAWQGDESQNRTAWDFNANIGTLFARDFEVDMGSVSWFNHAIRPEIGYDYITVNREDELPRIDEVDGLDFTNKLTYSLNNYFRVGGRKDDGRVFNRYIGYAKLEQSYDIEEQRRDLVGPDDRNRPFSDLAFTLNIYPLPNWQTKYETHYSVYGQGFSQYDLYTRYTSPKGHSLSLDYRYTRNSEINEFNANLQARLTDTIYVEGDLKQSLVTDDIVNASVGLVYHPQCWAVKLYAEKNSDDERIAIMFSLVGLGEALGIGLAEDMQDGLDIASGSDGLELD